MLHTFEHQIMIKKTRVIILNLILWVSAKFWPLFQKNVILSTLHSSLYFRITKLPLKRVVTGFIDFIFLYVFYFYFIDYFSIRFYPLFKPCICILRFTHSPFPFSLHFQFYSFQYQAIISLVSLHPIMLHLSQYNSDSLRFCLVRICEHMF